MLSYWVMHGPFRHKVLFPPNAICDFHRHCAYSGSVHWINHSPNLNACGNHASSRKSHSLETALYIVRIRTRTPFTFDDNINSQILWRKIIREMRPFSLIQLSDNAHSRIHLYSAPHIIDLGCYECLKNGMTGCLWDLRLVK
jgi:hypothetical protein